MGGKTVTLTASRNYPDVGTVGQDAKALAQNVQTLSDIIDVGCRNTRNLEDSFVRVGELVQLGLVELNGRNLTSLMQSGALTTVTVAKSITGDGSTGSPLELDGDVLTPGNSYYYGTNSSGVKGWYAISGGGSYTPPVTTKGDLFGYDTAPNRIPVGTNGYVLTADSTAALGVKWAPAGGSPAAEVPATIADLVFWFTGTNTDITAGRYLPFLQNSAPYLTGMSGYNANSRGIVRSASDLNSKPVFTFDGSSSGFRLMANTGPRLDKMTVFIVFKAASLGAYQSLLASGSTGALQFTLNPSSKLELDASGVAAIGNSTTTLSTGTWYQANATYDASTGSYAFRLASAADGSGTNAQTISAVTESIGYNSSSSIQYFSGDLAELIIYDRVLSGSEIASVEAYLTAKWGV